MDATTGENPQSVVVPPVEGVGGGGTAYGWTDGSLECSYSFKGVADPAKVPSAELLYVWCMPSTATIGQQEMPRPLESISLLAARNERESVQIAMRPKASWGGLSGAGTVQIRCSDLCSSSGDRLVVGQSLTLRRVVPVLGVPDALAPLDLPEARINLLPGETASVWASIDVPTGQPPGQYEGHIFVTAVKTETESLLQSFGKSEKYQLYKELKNCLDVIEPVDEKPLEEVVGKVKCATSTLKKVLSSAAFQEFYQDNGSADMMDEDALTSLSIHVKINITVWEFTLPQTPSLPAVFGISETVIEDRFGLEHGSDGWYNALDQHFNWLLRYRISPFFCRWGDGMRILAYTCPWPADHPKSDEYYSNPRLAAYAVPYAPILYRSDAAKVSMCKELEILKSKVHWPKAYFYLWDEPLNLEQYEMIQSMSSDIRAYAPDARVLTTYYCGPSDAHLPANSFEAFVNVPNLLRPHSQIFCTSEWVLGSREDLVKDIIAELQPGHGEEWWTYVCLGPSDPLPNLHLGMRGTQNRAVVWRVWKEGSTGFLYWGTNCYEKTTVASGEIRFRRGLPPGDGVLFYPGEVFSSSHEPVASARLEHFLSGMQDIEYLNLYSSRFGREEGLSLLERTGVYLGPERYTLDHMAIAAMRAQIYQACRPFVAV
ncbi:hypothetical protein IHE45_13G035100 [Dioscorea alata]|uniref:Uncharacterized protein n=2 Tax=Dioscorea alata TaxID=55571 RepID=A0ACB7UX60_DIOAL|nr:hypothetical protein IHE45_13G035100 [Dioscorea alata]KAH7665458.1 hypothetical protein IHE45_13G035100 [Dioscorea alata]